MERELKANSDAMEKNNEDLSNLDEGFDDTIGSGKGLGDVLDDLTGKLGINLPEGATSTAQLHGLARRRADCAYRRLRSRRGCSR